MESTNPLRVTDLHSTRTFNVDAEHSRLRLVVVLVFAVGAVAGYLLISAIVPSTGLNLIAALGAFVIAYAVSAVFEQALKRRWPSGRSIEVDAQGVRLIQNGTVQQNVTADASAQKLLWRFQTKRRSRVPKGWHLLAAALEQNTGSVSVYTLVSPDQFKKLENADRFKVLKAKAESASNTSANARGRDDLLLAGEQRRLLAAENQRWQTGAEMTLDDFLAYLDAVEIPFPTGTNS
jgi:hypothetical protein